MVLKSTQLKKICKEPKVSFRATEKNVLALLAVIFCLMPTHVSASAGTSGANILSMPIGARAIAMGEAFTAQSDDVSSLYWNPAGLAILNQSQASFMYNQFLQDQTFQNLAVATPLENGGIGGSLSYQSFGQIKGFDAHAAPTGDVQAYSTVGTIGGGLLLGPLSLGANLKGVQSKLADVSAAGVATDMGAIYTLQREVMGGTIRVGATVRNIGTGLKFINQRDPFPLEWRLGVAAVQMHDKKLNMSLDYGQERDVKGSIYSGLEYWLVPMMALRAGYAGTHQEGNGLRLGLGLRIRDFSFDYAYSAYGDLGMTHRYEVSMHFGAIQPRLTPEERALFRKAKLAMAQGHYSEAFLLSDSLLTMEPAYKPFYRLNKSSMKLADTQEHLAKAIRPMNIAKIQEDDGAMDLKEVADLLQYSADVEKIANAQNGPKAEESTLAPIVGTKAEKKR